MAYFIDLTGQTFGALAVLERINTNKKGSCSLFIDGILFFVMAYAAPMIRRKWVHNH